MLTKIDLLGSKSNVILTCMSVVLTYEWTFL